jgi:hypothetical protein
VTATRRKAFTLAREIGLDRQDRIDLARMLLADDDIDTWATISEEQERRLLDALEGFLLITHLLIERNP